HLKARKMLLQIEDPIAGKRIFTKSPFRMTNTKEVPTKTAPELGQHTEEILREVLEYDGQKIQELREEKVV
ncbi:MAG: CoA transferase, partial [Proteobacteria bacterium]|nr:CoA transferase [Pseudomonadota bacterium]